MPQSLLPCLFTGYVVSLFMVLLRCAYQRTLYTIGTLGFKPLCLLTAVGDACRYSDAQASTFLIVLGALACALYLSYLLWVVIRSLTVIRSFKAPERALFGLHALVLIATAGGIGAGSLYQVCASGPGLCECVTRVRVLQVDIHTALDLMFYNALFNVYVCLLAYLYTPFEYEVSEVVLAVVGYLLCARLCLSVCFAADRGQRAAGTGRVVPRGRPASAAAAGGRRGS
jgi:hypothetical protein